MAVFSQMTEELLRQGQIEKVETTLASLEKQPGRVLEWWSWDNLLARGYAGLANYYGDDPEARRGWIEKAIDHHAHSAYPSERFLIFFSSQLTDEVLEIAKEKEVGFTINKELWFLGKLCAQMESAQNAAQILPWCSQEIAAILPLELDRLRRAISTAGILNSEFPQETAQVVETLISPHLQEVLETISQGEMELWGTVWGRVDYPVWEGLLLMGRGGKEIEALKMIDGVTSNLDQKIEEAVDRLLPKGRALVTDGYPQELERLRELEEELLPKIKLSCEAAIAAGMSF